MAVKSGRAICFPEDKVRPTGRGAIGVFGIELDAHNDEVIGMLCVSKTDITKQILVVSEKGLGKRTPFLERSQEGDNVDDLYNMVELPDADGNTQKYLLSYRVTNRGGKGVKTMNITEKTGALVGLLAVEEKDDLMITCESGVTIRMKVTSIREAGRATQGVKLINIDDGDRIAAIAAIMEQEEVEEEGVEPGAESGTVAPAEDKQEGAQEQENPVK
jgi:DNA gyrase subunit A